MVNGHSQAHHPFDIKLGTVIEPDKSVQNLDQVLLQADMGQKVHKIPDMSNFSMKVPLSKNGF